MGDDLNVEAELRATAADPELPAHLRLGVLKQLAALRDTPVPARGSAQVVMPDHEDGLPPDPLLEQFPPTLDEHGLVPHEDPFADLDFCQVVGRMPHALYAKVLWVVPPSATSARWLTPRRGFSARHATATSTRRRMRCAGGVGVSGGHEQLRAVQRRACTSTRCEALRYGALVKVEDLLLSGAPADADGPAVPGILDNPFVPTITATNLADAIGRRRRS